MPKKYLTKKNTKSKFANKRNELQKEEDRLLIIKFLKKGTHTYQNITDEINARYKKNKLNITLSLTQIRKDIAKILSDLVKDRIDNTSQLVALQEIRYLKLAQEALEAWEKSKEGKPKKKTSRRVGEHTINNWSEEQEELIPTEGDIKYLNFARSCYEKIDKINGLNVTKKEEDIEEEIDNEEEEQEVEIGIPSNNRDEEKKD